MRRAIRECLLWVESGVLERTAVGQKRTLIPMPEQVLRQKVQPPACDPKFFLVHGSPGSALSSLVVCCRGGLLILTCWLLQ